MVQRWRVPSSAQVRRLSPSACGCISGPFNSRFPFSPPLLPSGPTFFGELTWMWQHSLAAEAGVSYGMRGEYGGGGGRMRPMSKAGNHAGQQATLRLLWKSPHVMRSGALRNALPSRTCVNVPVVVGGRQWTIDVFVCLCIFVSTPPFKS